jgi:hypothetical protein
MKRPVIQLIAWAAAMVWTGNLSAAGEKKQDSKLQISINESGQVVVTWKGKAELAEARGKNGIFKKIQKSKSPHIVSANEEQAAYRLESETSSSTFYSVNVVGYANLNFPPGLTLFANPLYANPRFDPRNDVAFWMPAAPDGSQVYKYNNLSGDYQVSTFDGIANTWSDPTLELPMGEGFFFQNNSDTNLTYTFVGEVPQGCLTNALPEGYSTKGALVPQTASLSEHLVVGEIGDEVRIYTNDLQGGGSYDVSVYTIDGWTPNLTLKLGQAFWIYKQNPQDWVRCFWVN